MKFVKIQDGVIIRRNSLKGYKKDKYDPKGCHYYIAKYNPKKQRYDMYPTSHYVDPKKENDVRHGNAILLKIRGQKHYSTVYKQPRTKDVHGQPFTGNFKNYEVAGKLSFVQKMKFERFIRKKGTR